MDSRAGWGRLVVAIVAALVCVALVAGCGGGGSSSSATEASTGTTTAPEAGETEAPPAESEGEASPPETEAEPLPGESEGEGLPGEPEGKMAPSEPEGAGPAQEPEPSPAETEAPIVGLEDVVSRIGDLPQQELVLGDPHAPVEVEEFGDLQCPICRGWAEQRLPAVIAGPVAAGKVKLAFRNFLVIGPESRTAGAAALAAGKQGRGWQFIELFFRNQGPENGGYVTGRFLTNLAVAAGVSDIPRWNRERQSAKLAKEPLATTAEAARLHFSGTPSFAITGPKTHGRQALGTPENAAALLHAIKQAGG
jgi:protein-disulfide isomerase